MVYGIVTQHKGFIHLDSAPGQGSTFTVCIPLCDGHDLLIKETEAKEKIVKGEGTVLVVDDENTVLSIAEKILNYCGYTVTTAENGYRAIEIFKNEYRNISIVLLDFSMPGMSGIEVFDGIKEINPSVKVLLVSGFIENEIITTPA
jgi:response regulator RpfG family c-di-GMP phosphodiesterase